MSGTTPHNNAGDSSTPSNSPGEQPLVAPVEQLSTTGRLLHLLHIQGLPQSLLIDILDTAKNMVDPRHGIARSLPLMRGMTVMNVFFENSTRTRTNFELAAKRLAAHVINLDINTSSTSKGESLSDTIRTLDAMGPRLLVVRHSTSGASRHIAALVSKDCGVINAGDGSFEHPTQALLDAYTIREHMGGFSGLKVAVIGDIAHSRVAQSQICALQTLGVTDIRLIAPPALTQGLAQRFKLPVFTNCDEGLSGCNIVSLLRIQRERIADTLILDLKAYYRDYGITLARLKNAARDAIVLHPGPINRGVEIADSVADGPQAVILKQVSNGVAVRMAVMSLIVGGQ